jgi:ABC-type dipeptide/oligopeptide/nickel transport system permease subunit
MALRIVLIMVLAAYLFALILSLRIGVIAGRSWRFRRSRISRCDNRFAFWRWIGLYLVGLPALG